MHFHACMSTRMYVYVCMNLHVRVCMHVSVYVCMYCRAYNETEKGIYKISSPLVPSMIMWFRVDSSISVSLVNASCSQHDGEQIYNSIISFWMLSFCDFVVVSIPWVCQVCELFCPGQTKKSEVAGSYLKRILPKAILLTELRWNINMYVHAWIISWEVFMPHAWSSCHMHSWCYWCFWCQCDPL